MRSPILGCRRCIPSVSILDFLDLSEVFCVPTEPCEVYFRAIESAGGGWQQAIDIACRPLVDAGCVDAGFGERLIANVRDADDGGFVAPCAVLPLREVIDGVRRRSQSVLLLRRPFYFDGSDMPIRLLVLIAAADAHDHLAMLRSTMSTLNDAARLEGILDEKDAKSLERAFIGGEV